MRPFLVWLAAGLLCAYAAVLHHGYWKKGKHFNDYLKEHGVPLSILEHISKEDRVYLSEIRSSYPYFELLDTNGTLEQALIPISKEMQISLVRKRDGSYTFDIIPIVYTTQQYVAHIEIAQGLYRDIAAQTQNKLLASKAVRALKGVIDTKRLHKGDTIDILYRIGIRNGLVHGEVELLAMRLKQGKKLRFICVDEGGRGCIDGKRRERYTVTKRTKSVTLKRYVQRATQGFIFPLRHPVVTSSFSYRRWHPILHRYRPHHGTDFRARYGTPLYAVADGKVSYAGWMRGYGKVVKIRHAGGYESLYAHQSRIRVRRGQRVRQGQIIGYAGSTGRSTGPHLHFGLTKNGRWINPMRVLGKGKRRIRTKRIIGYKDIPVIKYRTVTVKGCEAKKRALLQALRQEERAKLPQSSKLSIPIRK